MSLLQFLSNFAASMHTKLIRFLASLMILQAWPAFANISEEKNPYLEIRELSHSRFNQLFEDYINKNNLKQHGFYFGKTIDVIRFLEQFVNLEELECGSFLYPCVVELDEFTKNPPRLPQLKSLILKSKFSSHDLAWLLSYPSLQSLTIYDYKEINVAPLESIKHLLDLNFLWSESNAKIVNANCLPSSLQSLHLEDCYIDPADLNHLKLRKLQLSSKYITSLPDRSSLNELEYLDLSGSSISNLNALEGNRSLKVFIYHSPARSGVKADFSVLNTLSNLEELGLGGFPQISENLENAVNRLSNLKRLTLSGQKLLNLTFLEGLNLSKLSIEGRLLGLIPDSILRNPTLTDLETWRLEFDSDFSWNQLSPNIRYLNLGYSDFCDLSNLTRLPLVSLNCLDVDCINNEEQLIAFAPTLESLICKWSTIYSMINVYGEEVLTSFLKLRHLYVDFYENDKFNSLDFLKKFPILEELKVESARELPPEAFDVFLEIKNLKNISVMDTSFDIYNKIQELLKKDIPID